jgi:hypothetical protein
MMKITEQQLSIKGYPLPESAHASPSLMIMTIIEEGFSMGD